MRVFLCFSIRVTDAPISFSVICLSRKKNLLSNLIYGAHNFAYFSIPLYMFSSSVKTFSLETFSLADSMCVRFEFLTALISETFVF